MVKADGTRKLAALYICYLSLDDPLVHTQVVAYLRGLAAGGHRIHLLTFEVRPLTRARRRELRRRLMDDGISWHGVRYHKRPSLPATVYDTLVGAAYASMLVMRHQLDALHARAHVPAAMALIAKCLIRRHVALIFDIRGLMAEEYEDAGRWLRDSLPFRLTKAVERVAIRRADGIVVLTERIRRELFGAAPTPGVHVIPCCADLDGLSRSAAERELARRELGLADAITMVYVGKFGGWYMAEEMAEFSVTARRAIPNLRFLILTQGDRTEIRRELERHGAQNGWMIESAPPEEVGRFLAASDFGISFIRPSPSKASSSPTKVGEYLGAGLPVLATAGVGDLDTLIGRRVGVLVHRHDELSYRAAVDEILRLLADPETPSHCRALAREELSLVAVAIPRYSELYSEVADRLAGRVG